MFFRHFQFRPYSRWKFTSSRCLHILRCHERLFTLRRQLRQAKLLVAARLADYLVVDCSYADEYEGQPTARNSYHARLQLKIHSCFTSLYRYHSPSFVLLCNVASNDHTGQRLHQSPYCHATSLSYLDLFPAKQLVYLSPDSPNVMQEYDHDVVYILGGIFQKTKNEQLTLNKAHHERIQHQSLPVQQYLRLSPDSSPVLSLNQVYNILMTLKHTNNNWRDAFRCIPEHYLSR